MCQVIFKYSLLPELAPLPMNDSNIIRSDDLRAENRHRILRTLRKYGPLSRAEVGAKTGLSQAALSTLLGLMSQQGIVTSTTRSGTQNKRGRPQTTIALREDAGLALSVALTIDRLTICAIDYAGNTFSSVEFTSETVRLDAKELNEFVVTSIKTVLDNYPDTQLKAISFGFQGATDSGLGELLWSPILSIQTVPIGDTLLKAFDVPVSVNNDCGLIAAALHHDEHDTLGNSFATILLSHGVGMGLYLSGQAFSGAQSSALELGHIPFIENGAPCRCGKHGCIEAYAADYGILRTAEGDKQTFNPDHEISTESIQTLITRAKNNEPRAIEAFAMAGRAIGAGLVSVFTLFDPIPIALVGHESDAIELMRPEIDAALRTVRRSPENLSDLLHCYSLDTPLLRQGLRMDALSIVDREFANTTEPSRTEPRTA